MKEDKKNENKKEENKLSPFEWILISLSIISICFAFFAPKLYVYFFSDGLNNQTTGQTGDTIGGLMNPYIGIAGVLVTFLAFYIQYKANKFQRESFEKQLDRQKTQFELELSLQKIQFSKNQFEMQFFEMLKIHRENVNELNVRLIPGLDVRYKGTFDYVKGRDIFEVINSQLIYLYKAFKQKMSQEPDNEILEEAYNYFFHKDINIFRKHFGVDESFTDTCPEYTIEHGLTSTLSQYIKHLFHTVKFVVNQDEKTLSYEDKRHYLRILRAQLSNQEQVTIFYNWYSGFGIQWENDKNKFFSDYRMIHNIYQELLHKDFQLEEIFNIKSGYKKEKDRDNDPFFEFQDWKK